MYKSDFTGQQVDNGVYFAGIELYMPASEVLSNCAQDTWYSPTTAALTGNLEVNMSYSGGQISYDGDRNMKMRAESIYVVTTTGLSQDIEVTFGVNGVPDEAGAVPASTFLTAPEPLYIGSILDVEPDDTVDFFIRQTSSATPIDLTIQVAKFHVGKEVIV